MFNYNEFIKDKLNRIKENIPQLENEVLEVADEQAFAKIKTFAPNTIYVVIKYLSSTIDYGSKIQPVQLLCMSESNSLVYAKELLDTFANTYNYVAEPTSPVYVKHQYTNPVVISNYNEVGNGYRSLLYVSGTLYILENVLDVSNVSIDNIAVTPLGFTISYGMTPNTQPIPDENIAVSVKSASSLTIQMTLPVKSNIDSLEIFDVMLGDASGNEDFTIKFTINGTTHSIVMKLLSATMTTAPSQIPGIQLGFIR